MVEISSYQLEGPGPLRPQAAAILNLTPDHLGRHGDMATYAATKLGLFRRMGADALAVLPAADPWLPLAAVTALRRAPRLLTFGALPGATHDPDHIHFEGTEDDGDLALAGFPLPGPHNRDNLAVAMLLAMTLGLRRAAVDVAALRPLPHRMERVHEAQGRVYINASKATNVDAARVDIAGAPLGAVVLLGGAGKDGADYEPLVDVLNERRARAICFGASGPEIAAALTGRLPQGHLQQAPNLAGALDRARQDTADGGCILLCPACASFDEFTDFEHRGRVFGALARGQTVAPGEDPA